MYAKAQAMRRDGTAPRTLGIADDLPNRFALEQLSQLAGMANKVRTRTNTYGRVVRTCVCRTGDSSQQAAAGARACDVSGGPTPKCVRHTNGRVMLYTCIHGMCMWHVYMAYTCMLCRTHVCVHNAAPGSAVAAPHGVGTNL
jgi:hypothetical protein